MQSVNKDKKRLPVVTFNFKNMDTASYLTSYPGQQMNSSSVFDRQSEAPVNRKLKNPMIRVRFELGLRPVLHFHTIGSSNYRVGADVRLYAF